MVLWLALAFQLAQPDPLREQARSLFAARQFAESGQVYQKMLAAKPGDEEALSRLGVIEGMLGNHEAAARYLERAVARNPRSAAHWNNLAINQSRRNRPREAAASWEQALKLAPNNANTLYNLGSARFDENRCDLAVPLLERARQSSPADAALDLKLTLCGLMGANPSAAVAFWRQSTALRDCRDEGILLQLSRAFQAAGQPEPALELLDGRFPLSAAAQSLRGDALEQLGRLAEALPAYEAAIQLAPGEPAHYLKVISILLLGNAPAQARLVIATALERFPNDDRFGVAEAYSWELEDQRDKALASYRALLARHPKSISAHVFLSRLFLETGRKQEAVGQMKAAVAAAPDSARAHYQLAMVTITAAGVSPAAIQSLEQAIRLDPDYANARYQLGKIAMQNGDFATARTQLEQVEKLNPLQPECHYALGQVYQRLGLSQKAAAQFQKHKELRLLDRSEARANQQLVYELQ